MAMCRGAISSLSATSCAMSITEVDADIIWDVTQKHLSELQHVIEEILRDLR